MQHLIDHHLNFKAQTWFHYVHWGHTKTLQTLPIQQQNLKQHVQTLCKCAEMFLDASHSWAMVICTVG